MTRWLVRAQPFELTKLALVTVAACALMRPTNGIPPASPYPFVKGRLGGFGESAVRWLRALIPLSLLLAASGFALIFLRDFSPLVLLLIGALALGWAWLRVQSRPFWRWGGGVALASLTLLMVLGGYW